MNVGDLIGKSVVSMSEGENVGKVQDLLVDTESVCIVALVLDAGSEKRSLLMSDVRSVGPDAITVDTATFVDSADARIAGSVRPLSDLRALTVVDGSGTALGTVDDLAIESNGKVESLMLSHGGVFGVGARRATMPATCVRSFGSKLLTVEPLA
jgi:sporulation protein YlmC with PRC-barrel domain